MTLLLTLSMWALIVWALIGFVLNVFVQRVDIERATLAVLCWILAALIKLILLSA